MSESDGHLFDMASLSNEKATKFPVSDAPPIWTRNKAQFIARYLKAFTYVTKHGTYIDAFAGPQHEETSEVSWAAKLVMENEPARIRNFYLFELDAAKVKELEGLRDDYVQRIGDMRGRSVCVTAGDCNQTVPDFLTKNPIKEKEASFCLFDQRTTECAWDTVRFVANHKGSQGGHKIELFYFLAQGWIDRAIKSWKKEGHAERCKRWWGNDDALAFLELTSHERGRHMAERFQKELGYTYAYPFPIQQEGRDGRIMFWMIHASDHPRAPVLMWQAYRHIGAGGGLNDPLEQLDLDFDEAALSGAGDNNPPRPLPYPNAGGVEAFVST